MGKPHPCPFPTPLIRAADTFFPPDGRRASRGRATGCIREEELLAGDLDYQDFKRLLREDEAVVLRTLLETFISPTGRKRIAQRFNAGFPGDGGTSPARDERDDRRVAQ